MVFLFHGVWEGLPSIHVLHETESQIVGWIFFFLRNESIALASQKDL